MPSAQGVNCYTFEFIDSFDCTYSEEVCVNTSPEIPVGVPNDFTICDTGITTTVDLRVNNPLLLNGLSPSQYQVNYFRDLDAANSGNGRITNTAAYPFGTTTQTIYGSVINIATGCKNIQPIIINIIDFSDISIPPIDSCEPLVSFDLEQYIRDNTSVGNSTDIAVTVHNSQNDANSGASPVQNIDNYNQGFGTEQFFVKFQSSTDVSCAGTSELIIDVVPGPASVALSDLSECSLTDEFVFDLTTNGALIENAQSPPNPNLIIEYFTDVAYDPADLIAAPAAFTNTSSPQTIFVKVTDPAFPDCFLELDFVIDVSIEPIFNAVDDIVKCDVSNDNEEVFDLTSRENDIVDGQTGIDVTYHTSMANAIAGTPFITTPAAYTNVNSPTETIYVRLTRASNSVCDYVIGTFDLELITEPVVNVVTADPICDADSDGEELFDFGPLVSQVLLSQDPSLYNVTFHEELTQAEAGTDDLPLTDYLGTTQFQTIYVRAEVASSPDCYVTGDFQIEITPLPVLTAIDDLSSCDDLTEDGVEIFDLRTNESTLISNVGNTNLTITYHGSQDDADDGSSSLNTMYENTASTETIFVRVVDNDTTCVSTTSFDITVLPIPSLGNPLTLIECDATGAMEANFTLSENTSRIIDGQTDVSVTYFESRALAIAGGAGLDDASYDNTSAPQSVFYRIENNSTLCYNVGTFDLEIITTPVVNTVIVDPVCDAGNDGEELFDFGPLVSQVLLSQNPALYNVTFHEELAQAEAGTDDLPLTDYLGTTRFQTIYVRAEVASNPDCASTGDFQIEIVPLPELTAIDNIESCDDLTDDGVEIFDLRTNESTLISNVGNTNLTITYHDSQNDANTGQFPLPTMYENTASTETIFVRVVDNDTTCASTTSFDIIVLPIPSIGNPLTLEECDATGAMEASFTLSENTSRIIDGQSDVSVTYFESRALAIAGGAGLDDSNYENTRNPQSIFYRIENNSTQCFNVGEFQIEAVDAPDAFMPSALEQCDSGNGTTTIDLNQVTSAVTGGQTATSLSFFESRDDAEANSGAVSRNYQYSQDTTIFIRVDDDSTDCASYTTVELIFNELPRPDLLPEYLLCVDENDNLINGPVLLNTGLNNVDFSFEWFLDGAVISGATSATYAADEPGDYEVFVTNISTTCENSTSTFVRQRGVPETYDVQIVTDPFSFNHDVIATATGPDEYWFSLDRGPYLYTGIFENVLPGPHQIAIAERNGCGEIIEEIFVFGYPDFFTPNDDGYHDTWNIIAGDRLPGSTVYVYDRYGKLIKQIDPAGAGWDGTFNGEPLPSSDYWFQITYEIDGVQSEARGHFAMKR